MNIGRVSGNRTQLSLVPNQSDVPASSHPLVVLSGFEPEYYDYQSHALTTCAIEPYWSGIAESNRASSLPKTIDVPASSYLMGESLTRILSNRMMNSIFYQLVATVWPMVVSWNINLSWWFYKESNLG